MANPKPYPILIEAILKNEYHNIIRIIEDNPSSINLITNDKKTPLMFAIEKGNHEIIKLLVEKGSNLLSRDGDGSTILQYAIYFNNNYIFDTLINQSINLDTVNIIGMTALHYALERKKDNYAMALISKGANVNILDNCGRSALCVAQIYMPKNSEIRKEIINHGAKMENPSWVTASIICITFSSAAAFMGLLTLMLIPVMTVKLISILAPILSVLALGAIASGVWWGSEPLNVQIKNPVKARSCEHNFNSNCNHAAVHNKNNQEMTPLSNNKKNGNLEHNLHR